MSNSTADYWWQKYFVSERLYFDQFDVAKFKRGLSYFHFDNIDQSDLLSSPDKDIQNIEVKFSVFNG